MKGGRVVAAHAYAHALAAWGTLLQSANVLYTTSQLAQAHGAESRCPSHRVLVDESKISSSRSVSSQHRNKTKLMQLCLGSICSACKLLAPLEVKLRGLQ